MYNAIITKIKNVRKHPNADRLLLGECFQNQVVVGLETKEEDLGIYFPGDGRLSIEFMEANNLIGTKDPVTNERTGGMFNEKENIGLPLREQKEYPWCHFIASTHMINRWHNNNCSQKVKKESLNIKDLKEEDTKI